jgi:CRP-like cAMP-binding protein
MGRHEHGPGPEGPTRSGAAAADGVAFPAGVAIELAQPEQGHYRISAGWAMRTGLLGDGRRQILELLLPGDRLLFPAIGEVLAAYELRALTPVSLHFCDQPAAGPDGDDLVHAHLAPALEHMVTLGRRTAYERMAALLASLHRRLEAGADGFAFPLKQEHVADYLGMSPVHVSRTLGRLRRNGLATVSRGHAVVRDPDALHRVAAGHPPPDDTADAE